MNPVAEAIQQDTGCTDREAKTAAYAMVYGGDVSAAHLLKAGTLAGKDPYHYTGEEAMIVRSGEEASLLEALDCWLLSLTAAQVRALACQVGMDDWADAEITPLLHRLAKSDDALRIYNTNFGDEDADC